MITIDVSSTRGYLRPTGCVSDHDSLRNHRYRPRDRFARAFQLRPQAVRFFAIC